MEQDSRLYRRVARAREGLSPDPASSSADAFVMGLFARPGEEAATPARDGAGGDRGALDMPHKVNGSGDGLFAGGGMDAAFFGVSSALQRARRAEASALEPGSLPAASAQGEVGAFYLAANAFYQRGHFPFARAAEGPPSPPSRSGSPAGGTPRPGGRPLSPASPVPGPRSVLNPRSLRRPMSEADRHTLRVLRGGSASRAPALRRWALAARRVIRTSTTLEREVSMTRASTEMRAMRGEEDEARRAEERRRAREGARRAALACSTPVDRVWGDLVFDVDTWYRLFGHRLGAQEGEKGCAPATARDAALPRTASERARPMPTRPASAFGGGAQLRAGTSASSSPTSSPRTPPVLRVNSGRSLVEAATPSPLRGQPGSPFAGTASPSLEGNDEPSASPPARYQGAAASAGGGAWSPPEAQRPSTAPTRGDGRPQRRRPPPTPLHRTLQRGTSVLSAQEALALGRRVAARLVGESPEQHAHAAGDHDQTHTTRASSAAPGPAQSPLLSRRASSARHLAVSVASARGGLDAPPGPRRSFLGVPRPVSSRGSHHMLGPRAARLVEGVDEEEAAASTRALEAQARTQAARRLDAVDEAVRRSVRRQRQQRRKWSARSRVQAPLARASPVATARAAQPTEEGQQRAYGAVHSSRRADPAARLARTSLRRSDGKGGGRLPGPPRSASSRPRPRPTQSPEAASPFHVNGEGSREEGGSGSSSRTQRLLRDTLSFARRATSPAIDHMVKRASALTGMR